MNRTILYGLNHKKQTMTKRPSYGIIETIGGICYAKKVHKDKGTGAGSVFQMKGKGKTSREIAEHFGLTLEQIKGLIKRHNRNGREVKQGKMPKPKGRPRKRPMTADEEKDRRIAQLEMEAELLRDFLRLTGRR